MSFVFLITLLNIMPNRLLLLILHCLFWVNQISWCQICSIRHLLLLANYWRKDKLVTVRAAISTPCGKGTSSPTTQYGTYMKICARASEDHSKRMGLKPWGSTRAVALWGGSWEAAGTWPGALDNCRQQIGLGWFTDRQDSEQAEWETSQIQVRLRKAS